jgi:hypothetical protein
MWRIAAICARDEPNRRVLRSFADFLSRAVHADPPRVEELVFAILPRAQSNRDEPGQDLMNALGSLMVLLSVSHERMAASRILDQWLFDAAAHEGELGHALHSVRDGLVLGYGGHDDNEALIRRRCQQFAARVIEAAAAGVERYLAVAPEARNEEENRCAPLFARLLDQASDQFYFASVAFRERRQDGESVLTSDGLKRAFLEDNAATFHRIGDVGTPHTIYHLIELLGFLIPADPKRVFDLVAHALLAAGRSQGYQFESLGAERFVETIGRFLADYRGLFEDYGRRDQLVRCLDAFVEAGWPAARRLLYRLPELLQ